MAGRIAIVACSVMKLELQAVIGARPVDLFFLEQGLHNTPQLMPSRIQDKISEALINKPEHIILGYGLCSNGILKVGGCERPLVAPRCHDCIALLLGSNQRYKEIFSQNPGTYYLTAGWINESEDPLGCVETKYTPRLGPQKAKRAMELELKNYTHICYIDNGLGDSKMLRARTIENCRAFNKEYLEIQGSLDYFKDLVHGSDRDLDRFIRLDPGESLNAEMFYGI